MQAQQDAPILTHLCMTPQLLLLVEKVEIMTVINFGQQICLCHISGNRASSDPSMIRYHFNNTKDKEAGLSEGHHGQQTVGRSSYLSELRSLIPVVLHHVAVPKHRCGKL